MVKKRGAHIRKEPENQLDFFGKIPLQQKMETIKREQLRRLGLRGNVFQVPEGAGALEREMKKLKEHKWIVICGSEDEAHRLNMEFWGKAWAGMRKPTAVSGPQAAENVAHDAIAIIAPDRKCLEFAKRRAELNGLLVDRPNKLEDAKGLPKWIPVVIIAPTEPEAKRHYDGLMDSVFGPIDNSFRF